MIDLNENTYCLGLWYLEGDGKDWLAAVTRDGDGPMTLRYRFRYYVDDKAFDSNDRKNWYKATCPPHLTEDEIVASIDALVSKMVSEGMRKPWRRVVRGGAEKTMTALRAAPFVHIQTRDLD